MLKVPEHLGEVFRPRFQLVTIGHRHTHQFGSDGRREGIGHIGDDVHAARGQYAIDQAVGDLLNVRADGRDTRRRERRRCQRPHARMRGRVEEQHLPHQHLRDRVQFGQPEGCELFGAGLALGGEPLQHDHHVCVTTDHPGMQVGIPVHRILRLQPAV